MQDKPGKQDSGKQFNFIHGFTPVASPSARIGEKLADAKLFLPNSSAQFRQPFVRLEMMPGVKLLTVENVSIMGWINTIAEFGLQLRLPQNRL